MQLKLHWDLWICYMLYVIKGAIHITISNYRTSMISTCTANSNLSSSTIGYTEVEHCLI